MSDAQLLIAHGVKLAILAVLAGLFVRRRFGSCWALTAYLLVALVGNSMTSFWPERFYNYHFYTARQAVFDALKLVIAMELASKIFAIFPGAMSRWRLLSFAVLAGTTVALILVGDVQPGRIYVAYDWQPRIVAGAIWMLCGIALLVAWHRLPIDGWHHAILVGYVPYLVLFTTVLNLIKTHGWAAVAPSLAIVDSLAYLALMLWWTYAAWRPAEGYDSMAVRVRRRILAERPA